MAIRITELRGREIEDGDALTTSRKYRVRETSANPITEADVHNAIVLSPLVPLILYVGAEPLARLSMTAEETGLRTWEATVNYGPQAVTGGGGGGGGGGDTSLSFQITGENHEITQSLSTVSRTAATGTAHNFKGTIGVDLEGNIKGCSIISPRFSFGFTRFFPAALIGQAYINLLAVIVGRVNSGPFYGFAAGEVLCTGVSGAFQIEENRWAITYQFEVSPNVFNIPVGDITVPSKKGWEYLWVLYNREEDDAAKGVSPRPLSAHVEQVYYLANFALLGV